MYSIQVLNKRHRISHNTFKHMFLSHTSFSVSLKMLLAISVKILLTARQWGTVFKGLIRAMESHRKLLHPCFCHTHGLLSPQTAACRSQIAAQSKCPSCPGSPCLWLGTHSIQWHVHYAGVSTLWRSACYQI